MSCNLLSNLAIFICFVIFVEAPIGSIESSPIGTFLFHVFYLIEDFHVDALADRTLHSQI